MRFSDQRILKTHLTETLGFEDRSGGERSWGQDPCLWLTLGDHTYKGASPESTNRDIQPHLLMPIKSKATFNPLNLSYRYNYMYTCSTPICFPEKKNDNESLQIIFLHFLVQIKWQYTHLCRTCRINTLKIHNII